MTPEFATYIRKHVPAPTTRHTFRWRSLLVTPHRGPQGCDVCGSDGTPRSWLSIFWSDVHSERRLACRRCVAAFLRSQELPS